MDAIVPPGNTNLVIDTENCHRKSGHAVDIMNRVSTAAENIMNNDNSNAHHLSASVERVGGSILDHVNQNGVEGRLVTNQNGIDTRAAIERNGEEGRNTTNVNGLEGRNLTNQNGVEGRALTREEGHETRSDVDKFGFHLASKIDLYGLRNVDGFKDVLLQNCHDTDKILAATKDGFKDILLQNCHNTDKIICNDNTNFRYTADKLCSIELNQAKDTAAIQLEAAKNTAAIQLEASKNKCSIELDAAKHAAEIAKQLAECCCEMKELVIEKTNGTDDLIRKLDEQRVRDELAKTREELMALKIRATIPPLPVASVCV